jgi:hypothetical protein
MAQRFLTNQINPCVMNNITQKTVDYIDSRIYNKNYTIVDFTWFNQYTKQSLSKIQGDFVVCVDVADPLYFGERKAALINYLESIGLPCIFVGPPNKFIPCPIIPFHSWLRFRHQSFSKKLDRDSFFISFNRTPHDHRKQLFQNIKKSPIYSRGFTSFFEENINNEISSMSLNDDIVKLQSLAQVVDEKQLYSLFEIVSETAASDDQVFFTEKIVKCIASETPLLLLGCRYALHTLKNYYGFTDFGLDDSYDTLHGYKNRLNSILNQADSFFSQPINSVFDNAKKNAYHLFNDFDSIHDRIVDINIEKSMRYVKNSITNVTSFSNSL